MRFKAAYEEPKVFSCRKSFHMLLAALILIIPADLAHADVQCKIVTSHEVSPAEKAYLDGNMGQAESLYRDAMAKSPHDPVAAAGLTRTLLREQKIEDASTTITAELAATPGSVLLLVAKAEVQYRQGKVAEAAGTADQAFRADPCNARLYLLRARIFRLNSMYASERRAIGFAHGLDPTDLEIRRVWLGTLPTTQRIDQQKAFLAAPENVKGEEREKLEKGLKNLEYFASLPPKSCHVASTITSTEIGLAPIEYAGNSRHISSWGLHIQFNNTEATLGVDTGASGMIINRAIAERAGLKAGARTQISGVGDQGPQGAYKAQVDSIRIGALEFKDCTVEVTDRKDILGMDGLIGTDVFSSYLVTLDYPMRKFQLSPLPPRPSDTGDPTGNLNTGGAEQATASTSGSTEPQDRYLSPTMKGYAPVFRSGHMLIVPVTLNGKENRLFLVDTGAFSTAIAPEAARAVTKVRGGDPGTVRGMSGEVAKVQFSEAVNFRFAGIEQQNNDLFTFDTSGLSRSAGIEISGFLGSTLLRQLTISIDYRDGLVKFDYDPHHGNHNF